MLKTLDKFFFMLYNVHVKKQEGNSPKELKMTFKTFEGIVKEHRPEIEVAPHGQYLGVVNSVSVAVIFNPPHGKVYHYNGTYCDVLNRLGIKACYRSQLNTLQENLKRLKTKMIGKVMT